MLIDYKFKTKHEFIKHKNKIQFPYSKYLFTDKQIDNMFVKLKKYNYKSRLLVGTYYQLRHIDIKQKDIIFIKKPIIILSKPTDYYDFTSLKI